jgi:adenylosuccinate synthase
MKALLVVGMGFGDCGKGSIVDLLNRKHNSNLNVRFNGGAQAAHHVVLADGRHHCFSQWGSGTFAGAKTYLSKYMLVNPTFMIPEGEHLISLGVTDAFERMFIDQNALLTTPFHVALNRLRETHRRVDKTLEHGTCGMGVGETAYEAIHHPDTAIRMRDVLDLKELARKLESVRIGACREAQLLSCDWPESSQVDLGILANNQTSDQFIGTTMDLLKRGVTVISPTQIHRLFNYKDTVVFEGAQGVLLDEEWGFHPHTTWSDCTFGNALKILKQFSWVKATKIGVTRAYHTRHGAGPLPSKGMDLKINDHNTSGHWQGDFRLGYFDFMLARYARQVIEEVDEIAVNHLDQVSGPQKVCIGHRSMGSRFIGYRSKINLDTHLDLETMHKEEAEPIESVASPIYTTLKDVDRLVSGISKVFKAPVTIKGYGPTAEDKKEV